MNQPNTTRKNNPGEGASPSGQSGSGGGSGGGSGSALVGRSMPESPEAEAAVLGSMILDRECIGDVIQKLERDSFYRPEHGAIFDALIALYERNSD
ncbi:MAG: hypothetical protein KAT00_09710, partial [Planctomycetes bacterium]|nr:hypothetical protein [Planctomycetota bacterium]